MKMRIADISPLVQWRRIQIGSALESTFPESHIIYGVLRMESKCRVVEDIEWDSLTVKGTCQETEKRYLCFTFAPDPATISFLLSSIVCLLLKSIRQDVTVQQIRNELTAKVYETHARLAVEVGDMSEYNQVCVQPSCSLFTFDAQIIGLTLQRIQQYFDVQITGLALQ
ncbi:hypothetical protein L6452_27219 [Arctium lappa]|uniref:Uncharacterized protein n=1 Tax=Arctium lappa TaxID=4217 RepID=A0ACB8ZVW5_ARCLA|nr:hypothetical protein L6452_27219 [Arctium lappa]